MTPSPDSSPPVSPSAGTSAPEAGSRRPTVSKATAAGTRAAGTAAAGTTAAGSSGDALQDRTMRVDTPENVALDYPLAGLGSRYAALFADALIMVLVGLGVPLLLALFMGLGGFADGGLLTGLFVLWVFLVFWGYFFAYEAFRDGQTPGKRWLSLRVVMAGGYPLTVQAAAIRNLVRIVDLQPIPACLLGGFVMLLTRQGQRLGDLAAGTVVVRELPIAFPEVDAATHATVGLPRLSDAGYAALESFADRHGALDADIARTLATRLSRKLAPVVPRETLEHQITHVLRVQADEMQRRRAARLRVAGGSAAATALLAAKRERWLGFHEQVGDVRRRGLRKLGEDQVGEFAARYREVSADLARARTYGASAGTVFALERLTGAAHNLFYRPARRELGRLGAWITGGYPRLLRRLWRPIGLAFVLLYGPGLIVYLLMTSDPSLETLLSTPDMIARAEAATEPGVDYRDTWDSPWMGSTALSSVLIANNVQVAFLAFASGILAALGPVFVLIFNGMHLGSALAVFANRGVLDVIGVFVLPHGVIELTAIVIAGGAGLWLGSAILLPGRQTRLAALATRARDAVQLVFGVALMLLVAGLIEGHISPARIPDEVKLSFAAVAAAGLVWYLTLAGRAPAASGAPTARRTA